METMKVWVDYRFPDLQVSAEDKPEKTEKRAAGVFGRGLRRPLSVPSPAGGESLCRSRCV